MARIFRVLLGNIGDLPQPPGAPGWSVTFPIILNPATAAQIAASLNGGGIAQTAVGTHFANFVGQWVLSGGNPEDGTYLFNNLPAGFQVVSQSLTAGVAVVGGPGSYTSQLTALGSGSSNSLNDSGTLTFTYNAVQSAFQLSTEKLGIDCTPNAGIISITSLVLTGTYRLGQSTITTPVFTPTIQNTNPLFVGDKVIITSNLPGLDGVTKITLVFGSQSIVIQYPDFYWFFVFLIEQFALEFYVPWGFGTYEGPVTVILEGTTFSGSVVAGVFNILYADGSGIYTLVKTQTNDTLYFRRGLTTDIRFIALPNFSILSDETYEEDFYSMLQYPPKILSPRTDDPDEDFDISDDFFKDFSPIAIPRIVVVTKSVEIPSPFAATGFLP